MRIAWSPDLRHGAVDPEVTSAATLSQQQSQRVERELKTPQFRHGLPTAPPPDAPADVKEQR